MKISDHRVFHVLKKVMRWVSFLISCFNLTGTSYQTLPFWCLCNIRPAWVGCRKLQNWASWERNNTEQMPHSALLL